MRVFLLLVVVGIGGCDPCSGWCDVRAQWYEDCSDADGETVLAECVGALDNIPDTAAEGDAERMSSYCADNTAAARADLRRGDCDAARAHIRWP